MRILELYAGIGGVAAAVEGQAEVALAIDHNEHCHRTYTANFDHPAIRWNLEGVKLAQLQGVEADLWWMSPPCQPYTVRGAGRDIDDPRSRSFLKLLGHLEAVKPRYLALENVPGFPGSRAHAMLRATLRRGGYVVREVLLCPTSLGVPNQRRRFYLLAGREGLPEAPAPAVVPPRRTLESFLDATPHPELVIDPALAERYRGKLPLVTLAPAAEAFCFTAAYGKSPVYSGSWLQQGAVVRRFSPREIARLLGFPERFSLPKGLPLRTQYKLVGNSLSVVAVRALLTPLIRGA